MWKTCLLLLAATAAFAEKDGWDRVRKLADGSELRVYKIGETKPVVGAFDELTGEALVMVLKDAQVSIPRESIDRIDSRPPNSGGSTKVSAERVVGTREDVSLGHSRTTTLPPDSTSANIKLKSGQQFRTVYRRFPVPVSRPSPR